MTKAETYQFLLDYAVDQKTSLGRRIRIMEMASYDGYSASHKERQAKYLSGLKDEEEKWRACVDLLLEEQDFHVKLFGERE